MDTRQQPNHQYLKGMVEPHGPLLEIPSENQLLYKVTTIENFLASVTGQYLYFNRVDSYRDFPRADIHDGEQPPMDKPGNKACKFEKHPGFSVADYYDRSRQRTYACSFSMDNSDHIWKTYGKYGKKGKVCLVYHFGKLRSYLNAIIQAQQAILQSEGNTLTQIFSINYGKMNYVNWRKYQTNLLQLPNPIVYTYLKDRRYTAENELRISLSALGIGRYALNDGQEINLPPSLTIAFDFKRAFEQGIISVLCNQGDTFNFLRDDLKNFRIDLT